MVTIALLAKNYADRAYYFQQNTTRTTRTTRKKYRQRPLLASIDGGVADDQVRLDARPLHLLAVFTVALRETGATVAAE